MQLEIVYQPVSLEIGKTYVSIVFVDPRSRAVLDAGNSGTNNSKRSLWPSLLNKPTVEDKRMTVFK